MKLDSFLKVLLPKDDRFFEFFERDAENLLLAAQIFKDLMNDGMSKEERAQKIKRIEVR